MKECFLVLRPKEPIRPGELKQRGDYFGSQNYIPGGLLMGSLARWLQISGRQGEIPQLVKRIRIGNLFPSPTDLAYPLPFPMTALECKFKGGFRNLPSQPNRQGTDGDQDQAHGIRDSLLIELVYWEIKKKGFDFPVPMILRCTIPDANGQPCRSRMEPVSGFYTQLDSGWVRVTVEKGLVTKVALSRQRRASQEQMLYRVVALRPRNSFIGRLWTDAPSLVDDLKTAVSKVGIGAMTSRGFGGAEIEQVSVRHLSIEERLRLFNDRLRQVWDELTDLVLPRNHPVPRPEGTYFSVDLLSPAILKDPDGLPTLKLTLRLDGNLLQPIWWATQPTFTGGFSTAWGLPKPTSLAACQGSVYVYHTPSPQDQILPFLQSLETNGVGDRVPDGIGEVLICHPFHQEVNPV
ncbi:MAG: CRISPR-associated RAMP protein Csx10 [Armatimonadetes bacterium]|nr:CRISPR-associated RAMP protein Csx10 [Armatimonadota bacterium]MDW8122427.1 CRISPR-associated RAMP protein Csx10 [Armatimonadota bacterium]